MLPALFFCVASAVMVARAQNGGPVVGASVVTAKPQTVQSAVWLPVFQFRSDFWVNLQHFLYLQARIRRGLPFAGIGRAAPAAWAAANLSRLSHAQRQAWRNAVDYYASHFAEYSFPYNGFLVRVDNRLSQMGDCPDITGKEGRQCDAGINPEFTAILEEAAPIYREYWWPRQDEANRSWISHASNLVQLHGSRPAEMLALEFQETWPADPIPVDVTLYAGPNGAYTTLGPVHITISSADPQNQGPLSIAVVFREASHVVAWPVEQEIVAQCRRQTKAVPRDLWHALAFYTTASIFERVFGGRPFSASAPGSRASFADRERAYIDARGWQGYERLLRRYWQPYLDGRIKMQAAIDNMVDAF